MQKTGLIQSNRKRAPEITISLENAESALAVFHFLFRMRFALVYFIIRKLPFPYIGLDTKTLEMSWATSVQDCLIGCIMSALRCNAPLKYADAHKQRPPINRQKLECHCNTSKILRKHDCAYMPAQTPHTLLINISSPNNVVSAKSPLFHFHFSFPQRHYTSLYSLFLDWSQAFDSIGHQHLAAALRRYGIPPILIHAIMALYHNAKFFVSEFFSDSPHHILHRGIRQGCPLSPFLFIIILSALTSDLNSLFQEIFSYRP